MMIVSTVSAIKNYTIICNNLVESKLSYKKLALLSYALSKPHKPWNFNIEAMSNELKEGYENIRKTLNELTDEGYFYKHAYGYRLTDKALKQSRPNYDEQERYKRIRNSIILDNRLSLKAKGVLITLVSKGEKWEVIIDTLVKGCTERISALKAIFKSLTDFGYLRKIPLPREKGRFTGAEIVVCDDPNYFPTNELLMPLILNIRKERTQKRIMKLVAAKRVELTSCQRPEKDDGQPPASTCVYTEGNSNMNSNSEIEHHYTDIEKILDPVYSKQCESKNTQTKTYQQVDNSVEKAADFFDNSKSPSAEKEDSQQHQNLQKNGNISWIDQTDRKTEAENPPQVEKEDLVNTDLLNTNKKRTVYLERNEKNPDTQKLSAQKDEPGTQINRQVSNHLFSMHRLSKKIEQLRAKAKKRAENRQRSQTD